MDPNPYKAPESTNDQPRPKLRVLFFFRVMGFGHLLIGATMLVFAILGINLPFRLGGGFGHAALMIGCGFGYLGSGVAIPLILDYWQKTRR